MKQTQLTYPFAHNVQDTTAIATAQRKIVAIADYLQQPAQETLHYLRDGERIDAFFNQREIRMIFLNQIVNELPTTNASSQSFNFLGGHLSEKLE